ncbi:hypothetical protein [Brevibacillus choshinensis]|uniref:Ferric oxidoreductase domain-containing protein n=1 Tax=Brevibacillus choshinensis TaxID=54911 RepID=A0ABX7FQS1_BRECH|nr:hypothetical protein [Brevibacillus choshinensis]QRG68060.1 hypothetical protein JNE38_02300 [Brevibacillus choshinensis]
MTSQAKPHWIQNKTERIWVYIALLLASFIVLGGIWQLYQYPGGTFHTRAFKSVFKDNGSLARLAVFVVLAHYAILFLFKKGLVERWDKVKKWLITASRLARKWHTPAALVALSLIVLHVVGAFLYGIELNFENVSGLLALCVLLPVPISGLLRYRKLDKKWHLRSGLAFAVLFFVHAFL